MPAFNMHACCGWPWWSDGFVAFRATQKVLWTIKKFQGSSELTLRAKVTLPNVVNAANRKEVRPAECRSISARPLPWVPYAWQ